MFVCSDVVPMAEVDDHLVQFKFDFILTFKVTSALYL